MFTKAFFFLGLLFLTLPLGALASPVACAEPATRCSCTDDEGNDTPSPDASLRDGDSCAAYCDSIGSVSYSFFCDEDGTPEDSGEISDYLDRIAALVGIETITKEDPAIPALNVPIPGLDLSNSVQTDAQGNVTTNMIGLYVNAVFTYGITLAALFGVLMLTIAGFQYMTAGGDKTAVTKAKGRMQNVLFGLVLLMASYAIAFIIDPRITRLQPLTLKNVEEIRLNETLFGADGSGYRGGTGAWTNLSSPYKEIVEIAKSKVSCNIPDLISSPTGYLPNQGNHHWYDRGRNGNYTAINALDWTASWGSGIYAPFAGTVTYEQQKDSSNYCGNRIYLTSSNGDASITICHVKDFTDDEGNFVKSQRVEKGDVIGHVGGLCCSGQPNAYESTQCNVSGTLCTDPTKNQNCSCQNIFEAGNTTGPHVHITFNNMPAGMMLSCLE